MAGKQEPVGVFWTGGYMWRTDWVGWGTPGRTRNSQLAGVVPGRVGGARGRPTEYDLQARAVEAWDVPALYVLFQQHAALYVGQTKRLGRRLKQHYQTDHLAERWDRFSWVTPWWLEPDGDGFEWNESDRASVELPIGRLLEEIEALLINFGKPAINAQGPDLGKHMTWLKQTRSEHAEPSEAERMMAEIREILAGQQ